MRHSFLLAALIMASADSASDTDNNDTEDAVNPMPMVTAAQAAAFADAVAAYAVAEALEEAGVAPAAGAAAPPPAPPPERYAAEPAAAEPAGAAAEPARAGAAAEPAAAEPAAPAAPAAPPAPATYTMYQAIMHVQVLSSGQVWTNRMHVHNGVIQSSGAMSRIEEAQGANRQYLRRQLGADHHINAIPNPDPVLMTTRATFKRLWSEAFHQGRRQREQLVAAGALSDIDSDDSSSVSSASPIIEGPCEGPQ